MDPSTNIPDGYDDYTPDIKAVFFYISLCIASGAPLDELRRDFRDNDLARFLEHRPFAKA